MLAPLGQEESNEVLRPGEGWRDRGAVPAGRGSLPVAGLWSRTGSRLAPALLASDSSGLGGRCSTGRLSAARPWLAFPAGKPRRLGRSPSISGPEWRSILRRALMAPRSGSRISVRPWARGRRVCRSTLVARRGRSPPLRFRTRSRRLPRHRSAGSLAVATASSTGSIVRARFVGGGKRLAAVRLRRAISLLAP